MGLLDLVLPGLRRLRSVRCHAVWLVRVWPPAGGGSCRPVPGSRSGVVVGDALELAVAAFAHEGTLRQALAGLKYGSAARVASPLADRAAARFGDLAVVAGSAVLVPVPIHPQRLRERGYNQAALLAAGLARACGLPTADLLIRQRATTRQHRLDRAARLRNLRDAFAVRPDARAPPVVILVDDILTTAATLEACAGVLSAAGAAHVFGFAVAREV